MRRRKEGDDIKEHDELEDREPTLRFFMVYCLSQFTMSASLPWPPSLPSLRSS